MVLKLMGGYKDELSSITGVYQEGKTRLGLIALLQSNILTNNLLVDK